MLLWLITDRSVLLSVCLYVSLSYCLSVCLIVCLFICLSVLLSVSLIVCLAVCLSVCSLHHKKTPLYNHLHLSACLSVCLLATSQEHSTLHSSSPFCQLTLWYGFTSACLLDSHALRTQITTNSINTYRLSMPIKLCCVRNSSLYRFCSIIIHFPCKVCAFRLPRVSDMQDVTKVDLQVVCMEGQHRHLTANVERVVLH